MKFLVILCGFLILTSCETVAILKDDPLNVRIPGGFPPIVYPEGNEPTKLRVELGRRLFYDNRLSANQTVNCSSCHVLSTAFTDSKTTSTGLAGLPGKRNSPTLANVAWMPRFMMEGGVPTLETQALAPLHDTMEMGMNMMFAVRELNQDAKLRAMSLAAYGRDSIDPFVVTRSLAAFQRTIISGDSRWDRYRQGQVKEMNQEELIGMKLFFSEQTNCGNCHKGIFYTDFDYYNIGLDEVYADNGKERASHKAEDIGKFKTPTLRNIALTSPYMHDGRLNSLEDVVAFYNEGGKPHVNKDTRIRPLGLTTEEQSQLVAFMKTLTDWNFVQNAQLAPLN